jgi:adenine-specific DNA glycosylase
MTEGTEQPNLGDEVRRLLSGVQSWARGVMDEQQHVHTRTCDWCPLCQFVDVVRRENPEVADKLAEAGAAVMGALRAVIDAASSRAPSPSPSAAARPRPRPHPPSVQHIALDDES